MYFVQRSFMLIYLLEFGVNCLFISVDLKSGRRDVVSGLQIRVPFGKLFSLFLIQNICCGYSKEPSQ